MEQKENTFLQPPPCCSWSSPDSLNRDLPMTDQPRDFPLAILTDFTPVPRDQHRHDGWGPDEQRAFIEALADCGSVTEACRYVGRSPSSAYRLRRHPEGAEF